MGSEAANAPSSSGAVANGRLRRLQCRERGVAGKPGGLGIFGGGHVLQLDGDIPRPAAYLDVVSVVNERRIGDDFEARAVETDARQGQDRGDVHVRREKRDALSRRSVE